MMRYLIIAVTLLIFSSCKDSTSSSVDEFKPLDGPEIIQKSMQVHGSKLLDNSIMSFSFRNDDFEVSRDAGNFSYTRLRISKEDTLKDILKNDGLSRVTAQEIIELPDSLIQTISSSVNSVVYFAQLPYSLDGPAVHKKLLGTDTINGKDYYEVQVTFAEEGGGEDHDDIFLYWIHQQDFTIDFLAYSYCEDDCGYRFRESVNRRNISGVIVQDYLNYESKLENPNLDKLDDLFEKGELSLLSKILTEDVRIQKVS